MVADPRPRAVSHPVISPNQHSAAFRARLLDSLYDGVYFVDTERRITYWNHGAERLTGFSAAEAVGTHCHDNLLAHVDAQGCQLCMNGCPLLTAIHEDRSLESSVYLRHKQGHRIPVSVRVVPIHDTQEKVIGAVEVFSDSSRGISAERRVSELESIAFRDPLTMLPNRRYIALRVQQSLEETREFKRRFALLLFDIDRFKRVNDTWGHAAGDALLRTVAGTLTHSLRDNDLVGRWGGDEFLAILADVTPASMKKLAERCRQLIAQCAVPLHSSRIQTTVSIGATMLKRTDDAEKAIERADRLMYQSKTTRNRTTSG